MKDLDKDMRVMFVKGWANRRRALLDRHAKVRKRFLNSCVTGRYTSIQLEMMLNQSISQKELDQG